MTRFLTGLAAAPFAPEISTAQGARNTPVLRGVTDGWGDGAREKMRRWEGWLLFTAAFPLTIFVLLRTQDGPGGAKGLPDRFAAPICGVVDWIAALFVSSWRRRACRPPWPTHG